MATKKANSQNATQIYKASLDSATKEMKSWPSEKIDNAHKTMSTKSLADFYQGQLVESAQKQ
jgi:hypothetical protein